jgi:hypothetical protein
MRFNPKPGSAPWLPFWFIAGLVLIGNLGIPSLLTAGQVGPPSGPPAASPVIVHTPPASYKAGEKIRFTAVPPQDTASMTFYYRTAGITDFQARPMAKPESGEFAFEFDTSVLAAAQFEYYIEADAKGVKTALPAGAPSRTFSVAASGGETAPAIPQDLPSPQAEESKFPFHSNGSLQHSFSPGSSATPASSVPATEPSSSPTSSLSGFTSSAPAAPPTSQSGNIQVAFGSQSAAGFGTMINANSSLTDNPLPGASRIDLTSMNVSVSLDGHILRAGDLNVNESEFSAYGLGRRGVEYAFDNRKIYLHAFDVTTQQLMGFKGLGIPRSGSSLMGAAAGFTLFQEAFTLRAIALTGKDDPSLAANIAGSQILQSRQGNVLALTQETKLFGNALDLKAEFAHSSYDQDLSDGSGARPDNAWSAGGTLSLGPLTLGTIYRSIGRDYNSIGLQFLANDRRGWDSNLLLSLGAVSLQGQFTLQRDNLDADPERLTTKARGAMLNFNLAASQAVGITLGYRLTGQTTYQGALETNGQDMTTNEVSAGLNLTLSPSIMLNLALTSSALRSPSNPSGDTTGLTLNIGGAIRAGEWLTFMPTLGLTRSETDLRGEVSTTLSAMVTGEIFLLPRVLSLLVTGSFNRMEMSVLALSKSMDVLGGINFYLGQLIHVNNLLLTVRGSYRRNEMSGIRTNDSRILAQTDFAF